MPAMEHTLKLLTEMRDEAREFRAETRENFKQVFHRPGLGEAQVRDVKERLASLETHMAALLATMPQMRTRIDALEERIAALEQAR